MAIFEQAIAELIWNEKYRYRLRAEAIDQDIAATWQRVAKAIAGVEEPKKRLLWERQFYQLLENFKFLPGGRILAGAGTTHKVTLCNCFVMDIAEDSLPGIFAALTEGALTLQAGGGVGYDFSVLRPAGELAQQIGVPAAGPVAFMHIWDTMCQVLLSTGARRGAMMGVLRCDHPDIETFIDAKQDAAALRHFNVSVMVSDAFMTAVKQNNDWPLIFPTQEPVDGKEVVLLPWGNHKVPVACRIYRRIKARILWEKILRAAYNYAEPGVLFSDTINHMNNLYYREHIYATNPCGEIPLPAYGACNLGALNLTQFIRSPFTDNATIDWMALEEATMQATRFLDNVVDVSRYPLAKQQHEAEQTRRIGLGLTGLGDALVMLNRAYDSEEARAQAKQIMQRICEVSWLASIELAKEKGSFLLYSPDYLKGAFVTTLSDAIQKQLAQHGVRNSHHNTIAPTGTISLLANNVSNGIEPIFDASYTRQVRGQTDSQLYVVEDYAYHAWKATHTTDTLPTAWRTIKTLHPAAHLQMQAVLQPFIDNAISKTINLPATFPFDELSGVYTQAYELGLKGCTIFRPNDITGTVLTLTPAPCCEV